MGRLQDFLYRIHRSVIIFSYDVCAGGLSLLLALLLRVGEDIVYYEPIFILQHCSLYAASCAVIFLITRYYREVWRYVSTRELLHLAILASVAGLFYWPFSLVLDEPIALPRSLVFINWFCTMALLGGGRFAYRMLCDMQERGRAVTSEHSIKRVLIIGVNDQAELFIRQLRQSPYLRYQVVGICAAEASRIGRKIHGVKIIGFDKELPKLIERLQSAKIKPDILLVTNSKTSSDEIRELLGHCTKYGMSLARLPRMTDIGATSNLDIKPVALEDLLGRPQAALDRDSMSALIKGKRVMITGAGGSIGGELVRQICGFNPSEVTLVDYSEYLLYSIDLEIGELFPKIPRSAVLANVVDQQRIEQIIAEFKPQILFHSAALKHVPLCEANPSEAVLTNVIGTQNVADACTKNNVDVMVLISTDKAVNPTSVMGASKRLAESYCQSLDSLSVGTRFITVRFGNVLGSTGSVVPLFERQLKHGGPLTVTDPQMQRYFMTIHEATELVLQAATLGVQAPSQRGHIFVLDMGQPIKILDLANHMISLAGLRPNVDIKIKFTGSRPGEKLYEELFYNGEELQETACTAIHIAYPNVQEREQLSLGIDKMGVCAQNRDNERTVLFLHELVPEYNNIDGNMEADSVIEEATIATAV